MWIYSRLMPVTKPDLEALMREIRRQSAEFTLRHGVQPHFIKVPQGFSKLAEETVKNVMTEPPTRLCGLLICETPTVYNEYEIF